MAGVHSVTSLAQDSVHYGWQTPAGIKHDWGALVSAVQDHIGSLNFGYRISLREKSVEYVNARAVFIDPHTIECTNKAKKVVRARRFGCVFAEGVADACERASLCDRGGWTPLRA